MLPIAMQPMRNLGLLLALTGFLAGAAAAASSPAAPVITVQPTNQTVNSGATATFTVTATGTAPTYQWKRGGVAVANGTGGTTNTYTTPATTSANDGELYTVTVTDGGTSVTSAPAAKLTVIFKPVIGTQPANATIVEGQSATFTVAATGNALSYQWKKDGVNVSTGTGGTTASYTTPVTVDTSLNGSKYTVDVTNTGGTTTSAQATLTVNAATAITITAQPANKSILVGQTTTFSVTVTGSDPKTYQWQRNAGALLPGGSGATAATYTIPPATAAEDGDAYRCIITNIKGAKTSTNATLTVGPAVPVGITTQPTNQTAFVGFTATFNVTASGSTPYTYQWKLNGTTNVGTNSPSYTTPVLVIGNNGDKYSVVITNANGANTITSTQVTLTVNPTPPPTITAQPQNKSVVVGQTATFTVTATGVGTLSYQWKKNHLGTVTNVGTNSASYTTPVTVLTDSGDTYTVVVTDAGVTTTSSAATLTVTPLTPPTITVQPANRTVVVGFPATFSVTATSTAAITYQWYKNGALIAGATGTTYTTPATTLPDNGALYTVIATNSAGGTTSAPATLTVETSSTSIPDYYFDADVGAVGMPGDASLNGDVFTVCGAGAGIGGTADAFNFLYQPLNGDGSVTARVTPGTSNPLAKIGVMIRETLTADSKSAGMFVTGADGTQFVQRGTAGGTASVVAGTPAVIPVPYWVRLARTGDTFVGSISADGSSWTVVSTATIPMPTGAFIGYAVTSGDLGALDCATVDSFSGTGGWRPALRKPSGGGGGGGGCGLLGLDGILVALAIRRSRRGLRR